MSHHSRSRARSRDSISHSPGRRLSPGYTPTISPSFSPSQSGEERRNLIFERTFKQYDKDNSNFIETCELKNLLDDLGWNFTEDEVYDFQDELDKDKDGRISFEEFLAWTTVTRVMLADSGRLSSQSPPLRSSFISTSLEMPPIVLENANEDFEDLSEEHED